jgi:hypothetical protein
VLTQSEGMGRQGTRGMPSYFLRLVLPPLPFWRSLPGFRFTMV